MFNRALSSGKNDKLELESILDETRKRGFSPIAVLFYDERTKLLGLAPLERVPDKFVEVIGRRLGDLPEKPWMGLGK